MKWRTDIENAPKDKEILVCDKEHGVRIVKWDFNNCGYTHDLLLQGSPWL